MLMDAVRLLLAPGITACQSVVRIEHDSDVITASAFENTRVSSDRFIEDGCHD